MPIVIAAKVLYDAGDGYDQRRSMPAVVDDGAGAARPKPSGLKSRSSIKVSDDPDGSGSINIIVKNKQQQRDLVPIIATDTSHCCFSKETCQSLTLLHSPLHEERARPRAELSMGFHTAW